MSSSPTLVSQFDNLSTSPESALPLQPQPQPDTPYPFPSSDTTARSTDHALTAKDLAKQIDLYDSPPPISVEEGSTGADIDAEVTHPSPPSEISGNLDRTDSSTGTMAQKKRKYSAELYEFHKSVYHGMKGLADKGDLLHGSALTSEKSKYIDTQTSS